MKPYCFVLMPFGSKEDENANVIQFDKVYEQIFRPAIVNAGLEPIRADEESIQGIIHKPMFERLMLCEYALADLTAANPNVFYELGVRHGIRPYSTVLTCAKGRRLPFDVSPLRTLSYEIDEKGVPFNEGINVNEVYEKILECKEPTDDSPVYQLVENMPRPEINRLKTDVFRDSVDYTKRIKEKLKEARKNTSKEVKEIEDELSNIKDQDPAVLVDILLSYRAVKDWENMVRLIDNCFPPMLKTSAMVKEQKGLALNRMGQRNKALDVLNQLIEEKGENSETNGILGRVYKDLWGDAKKEGSDTKAKGYLNWAIDKYLKGFESDWRDAYPGINAVTLMEIRDPSDNKLKELLPVVYYSVKRRLESKAADYWDYATMVELNVLKRDYEEARNELQNALIYIRENWEPETTANNLKLIRNSREEKGEDTKEIDNIITELMNS
jgi:tetratricopeptide (TPR) repeat protein